MSMEYCFDCDKDIDTDEDVEHFTQLYHKGKKVVKECYNGIEFNPYKDQEELERLEKN